MVERLEEQLSVFRESSEVSHINATAHLQPVSVEPRLFVLLQWAVQLHRDTNGAFDITAGPLSQAWGFKRRSGAIPTPDKLEQALSRVGSRHLRLDATVCSVAFDRPDMEINLGAIGKGYALDRCGEVLDEAGVGDYLLHAGSSSVLARGSHAATGEGWTIGLRHPLRLARQLGEIHLRDRALSTSGSGTQFFEHEGRRFGHILDPRTGWPAEGVLTATAIAPTAAAADALSTALYVMGPARAAEFCSTHGEIGAVLTVAGRVAGDVEVVVINLDSQTWTPQVLAD
jgi:thiamine biosynthesis lipoprotein